MGCIENRRKFNPAILLFICCRWLICVLNKRLILGQFSWHSTIGFIFSSFSFIFFVSVFFFINCSTSRCDPLSTLISLNFTAATYASSFSRTYCQLMCLVIACLHVHTIHTVDSMVVVVVAAG